MATALRVFFVLALMSVWVSTRANPQGPLQSDYYVWTCPRAEAIIAAGVQRAVAREARMAASLLRLHFHDCFVNGCDGSVLLDDTPTFQGEKTAAPNNNSIRGFEVIDAIKEELESACPGKVSCADILAVVARDSVVLTGGPSWEVLLGRRDSLTASKADANNSIPPPTSDISRLIQSFKNLGLTQKDLVALSGAHTIGKARCATFSGRIMGIEPDGTIQTEYLTSLQQLCSQGFVINNDTLAQLDLETPETFDNQYYANLRSGEGLLKTDQLLYSNGTETTRDLVQFYIKGQQEFFVQFKKSMVKMGNIKPLTGTNGEIRSNCRSINSLSSA